jgi:hypothetical protein
MSFDPFADEQPVAARGLSDDDVKAIVGREITAAEDHAAVLSTARQDALEYYKGVDRWRSKPGQSSVVTREVLETVEWILPQLLEVFAGTDEVVRFDPRGPEDEAGAEQATDYINHVWSVQNPGFHTTHTWLKDALLNRLGVIKIWWMDEPRVRNEDLYGVSLQQLQMLLQDKTIDIAAAEQTGEAVGPDGQPMALYDVRLTVTTPDGRVCIEPVPPEEFLFLPTCKNAGDPGQGQRRRVTQSDLIGMRFDPAIIDDLPTADEDDPNAERSHRFSPSTLESINRDSRDRASRLIEVTEWFTKIDRDGDGITEFVKVTLAGMNESVVLDVSEVDQPPFALLSPILMPHRLDGLSITDLVADLQEIKTAITRQALNSLYLANKPRSWIVDGQVNLQDYLNHEAGGAVRVKAPGMIGELNTTFVAGQAFPMLDYIDRTLETRSGISKMAQGIDPDVLHGGGSAAQTATGVAALQSAAQQRIALIARVMAETGIKHAFSLILRLVTKYQQSAKIIRLRNNWVQMDPREWDAEYDVATEVGLGTGDKQRQMTYLAQILQGQKEALTMGGLGGMVTPLHLYHTYAKLVQLSGLKNVDSYFADPSQQPQQPPAQPPPDPNMLAVQMQGQIEQAKLQLEHEKMLRADDRERDKLDADISLKAAELQAKYGAQINMAAIRAQVDRDREALRQQAALAKHVTPQAPGPGMPQNGPMQ